VPDGFFGVGAGPFGCLGKFPSSSPASNRFLLLRGSNCFPAAHHVRRRLNGNQIARYAEHPSNFACTATILLVMARFFIAVPWTSKYGGKSLACHKNSRREYFEHAFFGLSSIGPAEAVADNRSGFSIRRGGPSLLMQSCWALRRDRWTTKPKKHCSIFRR